MSSAPLLTLLAALIVGAPDAAGPEFVLEPGQERRARALIGMDDPALAPGFTIDTLSLVRDRVRVELAGEDGRRYVVELLAADADAATPGLVRTASAAARLDPALPEPARRAVVARLEQSTSRLRWKRLLSAVDPERARAEAIQLEARVAARLSARGVATIRRSPPPASELSGPGPPEVGALSAWLADPSRGIPCDACAAGDVARASSDGHIGEVPTAPWSDEPRVLVEVARALHARGEVELPAALLWQALASPATEPAADALAEAWGWTAGEAPEAPPRDLTLPLAVLLALVGAALLGRLLGRVDKVLLAAGCLAAITAVVWLGLGEGGAPAPARPRPAPEWLELGRGTACTLSPAAVASSRWQALVRCEGGSAGVSVVPGAADAAHIATPGHSVIVRSWVAGGAVTGELERWVRRLGRSVEELEAAGLGLSPGVGRPADRDDMRSRLLRRPAVERRAQRATAAVAAVALLAMLALAFRATTTLRTLSDRWLVGLALVAVVTHVAAPATMVMVYSGYAMVHQLVAWEALRYGAGANWLYGPWLELFGPDHGVVQNANRVYGLLGLLFIVALAARVAPDRKRLAHAVGFLAVLAPILWRDHASESILVAPTTMMLAALYGLAEATRGREGLGILALPCGLLAAMSRPELAVALLALSLLWLVHTRPRWSARVWVGAAIGVCAAAAASVAHLAYMQASVDMLVQTSALPGMSGIVERAWEDFASLMGLRVVVEHGPVWLLVLMPMALLPRGTRLLSLGIFIVTMAWMAVTRVDLPPISIPRVHAPPWLILTLVGGVGLDAAWRWMGERRWAAAGRALLVGGWVVTAATTVGSLFAPTNADAEEALIRDAEATLPASGRVCLATLDERDPPPPGKTHRFFPYYLLEGREPPPVASNLASLDLGACPDGAWAVLGMRCYMHLREDEHAGPAPEGPVMVEGCRTFRERWALTPVTVRDEPNRGDPVGFPMYPESESLRVGVYRVNAR